MVGRAAPQHLRDGAPASPGDPIFGTVPSGRAPAWNRAMPANPYFWRAGTGDEAPLPQSSRYTPPRGPTLTAGTQSSLSLKA